MARGGLYGSMLTGNWAGVGASLARLSVQFPAAMNSALVEEGEFYRKKIVEGIAEQAPGGQPFKPLSPVTLALRKLAGFHGTKALIRTGWLRGNVTVLTPNEGVVFVGIPYTARDPNSNRRTADIARLHEFGGTIRSVVSKARMRAIVTMLRKAGLKGNSPGAGGGGGGGAGVTVIPARPFIRPVFSMYGGRRGAERYQARVARKLGGLLGVINHPDLGGHKLEQTPEKFLGGNAGQGVASFRKGLAGQTSKRSAMQMFKRTFGVRGGAKQARKASGKARGPKLIKPKLPGLPRQRRARSSRPRALRPPKTPKLRAPRPPKAPKVPKLRAPKPYQSPTNKQAASFSKKIQKQQARSSKNVARQQARQAAQRARSKMRLGRGAEKVGKRVAREQRGLDRVQKQRDIAGRKAMRLAARQAKDAAKANRAALRAHKKAGNVPHDAHVKAFQKKQSASRYREKKRNLHDAHVRAFRSKQVDAHVRAFRHQKFKKKK